MPDQPHHVRAFYLRKLVYELNILRRHISSYPQGHPMVEQTLQRAYATVTGLLPQNGSLTIGIARDTLVLGDEVLDAAESAVRDFARSLFSCGIVSLTFNAGLRLDELRSFNEGLMFKSDEMMTPEAVRGIVDALELEHVSIGMIDYGAIQVRHGLLDAVDEPADFWERFAKGVLAGSLSGSGGDVATDDAIYSHASPEVLAEMLSDSISGGKGTSVSALLGLFGHFMQSVDENVIVRESHSLAKFTRFLQALKPNVREYFLESAAQALSDRPVVAEAFFDAFSNDLLAEMLNAGLLKEISAPPAIMGILQRLGETRAIQFSAVLTEPAKGTDIPENATVLADERLREKLQVIFREEHHDKFVPEEYNATLQSLLASRAITKSDEQEILRLRLTLAEHGVEVKISNIILELLDMSFELLYISVDVGIDSDTLGRNLLDLCGYFVRTGDFAALAGIYERTQRLSHSEEQREKLRLAFLQPDFLEEILQAPLIWGKQKFKEVGVFIRLVGEPFIDPMLDRLADENNLSLRRFYVDRLSEMGHSAIVKTGARLNDPRWYFVRNLVVILRNTGSPSILPFLRSLQEYPHPKVRQDVQKAFLQFHDPTALVMLLADLDTGDVEVKMGAIRLAERHWNKDIVRKLVLILESGGLSSDEIEMKQAAIRTLAGIGDDACLPSFERILRSSNFFRQGALNQLKDSIVMSLGDFRSQQAGELLQSVCKFGSNELARKAREIAANRERRHET
ncbi:MAG TPA: hypothetical protein VLH56_08305 [Dissulfurispiraceae bacterium]|nr:hypothetical protein [Dissulfurispiraceae bacterium]